jgi:hypothetical protein
MRPNPRKTVNELLEVRWPGYSRFQNATAKNVVITFLNTMTLCVHSRNDELHLAADYERYSHPSAPSRSVRHSMKSFCAGIRILGIQPLIQNGKRPAQSRIWVVAERPFRREPLWCIAGLTAKGKTTLVPQTVIAAMTVIAVLRESPGNGRTNHQNVIFMSFSIHLRTRIA